jgi:hypothetical protein
MILFWLGKARCWAGFHNWELWKVEALNEWFDLWQTDYHFRCRRVGCLAKCTEPNYRLETDRENRTHSFLDRRCRWIPPRRLGPPAEAGSGRRLVPKPLGRTRPAKKASAEASDIDGLPTEKTPAEPGAESNSAGIAPD